MLCKKTVQDSKWRELRYTQAVMSPLLLFWNLSARRIHGPSSYIPCIERGQVRANVVTYNVTWLGNGRQIIRQFMSILCGYMILWCYENVIVSQTATADHDWAKCSFKSLQYSSMSSVNLAPEFPYLACFVTAACPLPVWAFHKQAHLALSGSPSAIRGIDCDYQMAFVKAKLAVVQTLVKLRSSCPVVVNVSFE